MRYISALHCCSHCPADWLVLVTSEVDALGHAGTPLDPSYNGVNTMTFLMEDPCTQYSQVYEALLPLLHFLQSGGALPDPSAPAPAPHQATQPDLAAVTAAPGLAPVAAVYEEFLFAESGHVPAPAVLPPTLGFQAWAPASAPQADFSFTLAGEMLLWLMMEMCVDFIANLTQHSLSNFGCLPL